MSGFDKVVSSYEEALAGLEDNMTVVAGGFGLCGIPENLIKEIKRKGTTGLTIASRTMASGSRGSMGQISRGWLMARVPPRSPPGRARPRR